MSPAAGAAREADAALEQGLLEVLLSDHGAAGTYEAYRWLWERAPRLRTGSGLVVLSGHEDCAAALRDRALGKHDESLGLPSRPYLSSCSPGAAAFPAHRICSAIPRSRTSAPSRGSGVHPAASKSSARRSSRASTSCSTAGRGRGEVDTVADLALPLPVGVIGDLLGVPGSDLVATAPRVHALVAPLEPSADVDAVREPAEAEDELAATSPTCSR